MKESKKSDDQHMKKAMPIRNAGTWIFIAGVVIVLIIAMVVGLHYFRTL